MLLLSNGNIELLVKMLHLRSLRCRKTFIVVHKHRNLENTKFTKLVQVRNFITLELKVIRHEERETQSFYADCFYICPKPCVAPHLQTTGLASAGPESQPSHSDAGTCGDLGINSKTPNRILTRRLPDTKCINALPRIRLHASIRLKSEKRKIIKCKVANEKRSRQN